MKHLLSSKTIKLSLLYHTGNERFDVNINKLTVVPHSNSVSTKNTQVEGNIVSEVVIHQVTFRRIGVKLDFFSNSWVKLGYFSKDLS